MDSEENYFLENKKCLVRLIEDFIDGKKYFYAPFIAVSLRKFLYDGGRNSISILTQMHKKNSLLFFDTSNQYFDHRGIYNVTLAEGSHNLTLTNQIIESPLIRQKIIINGSEMQTIPVNVLQDKKDFFGYKRIPFDDWWKKEEIVFVNGKGFHRFNIITTIADQEGAHVDPHFSRNDEYMGMKRKFSSSIMVNRRWLPSSSDPLYSLVCQIGIEAYWSIDGISV
jgi:hypothetical protein